MWAFYWVNEASQTFVLQSTIIVIVHYNVCVQLSCLTYNCYLTVNIAVRCMHHRICGFYKPKGPRLCTSTVRMLLRAWGFITFVDSTVHVYNCFGPCLQTNPVLLFAICQSLYDCLDKILTIFIRIKDEIKYTMETSYTCLPLQLHVFMA